MARIRAMEKGTQSIRPHDSLVDCYFDTLTDKNGETLLHLSTFGSDHRKSAPKSSQSIQMDEAIAAQLIDVLIAAFPKLAKHTSRDLSRMDVSHLGAEHEQDSPIYRALADELRTD